jgi:hypothetical protein
MKVAQPPASTLVSRSDGFSTLKIDMISSSEMLATLIITVHFCMAQSASQHISVTK